MSEEDPEAQIPEPAAEESDPKPDDKEDEKPDEEETKAETEENPEPNENPEGEPGPSRPSSSKEEESAPPMSRQQSVKSQRSVTFSTTASDKELIEEDEDAELEKKSKQNCCVAIIAGMWASREMLKDNKDQQLYVKVTLRELFVYCIFMFIICYATFSPYSPYNYQLTNQISAIFPTIPSTTNMDNFWTNFVGDVTGLGGVFWETWYNQGMIPQNVYINCPDGKQATEPCPTELADRGVLLENRILGLPRIRQLKVRNDSCSVNADFASAIKVCFAPYDPAYEDKSEYIPEFRKYTSISAWTYQEAEDLGGTSYVGQIATYSGAGYTQNLHQSLNMTQAILAELQQGKWITQGTRFISFDFTVYNANVNLFCLIKLYFELPATGGVYPYQDFTTVKLLKYTSTGDYALMACEFMFCLYIVYYIIEETLEIKVHGISYFFSLWNCLDIGVIGISLAQIALNLYNQFVVSTVLVDLLNKPFEYADFSTLAKTSRILTQISAFNVFVAWIKLFKYLSFNKTMTQLSGTLSAAAKDLGGFSVMFFIIYFAFVQLGYLLFGVQCSDFRTFTTSVLTLFRMILGDFNFKAIEQANIYLGPIYFLSYIFFVFFVLLNMFLAIINDTYGEVKAEVNSAKAEFQMGDFFKTGSNNVKSYMGIHDRAIDVENAIKLASADDGFVTYEELRENLRKARFSDIEIDIFFFYFKNDPQMSAMMLDEEELKAKQTEKVGNDLSRPSIGGNEQPQRRKSRAMSIMPAQTKEEKIDEEIDEEGGGGVRPLSGKMARQIRSAEIRASAKAEIPVPDEEFYSLLTRVDKMESSIIPLGHKIDYMLARLDSVYKERKLKKDDMEKIFEGIVNNDEADDSTKRIQMENLIKTWDDGAGGLTTKKKK